MKIIRKKISYVSLFMSTIMLLIAIPYQPLLAAMVTTEDTFNQIKAQDARDNLKTLLSRNDIKNALISKSIDPDEAKARIDSLSDSEVIEVADKIEQLPAGGGAFGALIGARLDRLFSFIDNGYTGIYRCFSFCEITKKIMGGIQKYVNLRAIAVFSLYPLASPSRYVGTKLEGFGHLDCVFVQPI